MILRSLLRRLHAWPVSEDAESVTFALQFPTECADCAAASSWVAIQADGSARPTGHPCAQDVVNAVRGAKGWEHVYTERKGAEYRVRKA